jgi:hypothetical protein
MATHRINRAEIELEVGDVALAEQLIERVSLLRDRRIAPLLDRVCTELAGPEWPGAGQGGQVERVWRIDRLELELGAIAVEDFEDDFLRKLEAALRAALGKQLAERGGAGPAENDAIELLDVFARTGNVPWWADRSEPELVARHVRVLLDAAPHALLRLVRALAGDAVALARLARHCEDALLGEIVALTHQGGSAELLAGVRELERLLGRLLGAGASGSSRDRQVRARSALLAALANTDARAPGLLQAMLHELASASPSLWQGLAAGPRPATPALREALLQVGARLAASGSTRAEDRERAPVEARAGAVGRDRAASPATGRDARAGGTQSSDDGPLRERSSAVHDEPGDTASDAAASAGSLDARSGHEAPGPAPDVHAPDAPAPGMPALAETALAPDAPAPGMPALAKTALAPDAPAPVPAPPAPRDPREAAAARRRALERLEELHTGDAGLVILWPFLERFFHQVGLIDQDRRFIGAHARMQAIALLSQLSLADPEPPEFRLPLAKLLCGLAPDDAFALASPLAPAQLAECERLLAAVIDHASILRGMAVASFRATFLQRAGVLSVRDGAWLLQVERQAHDLVLDRFPWSWSWVKLPWMSDPLRVEW